MEEKNMNLKMKFGVLLVVCVAVLSGCVPGLFGDERYVSYKCSDGSTAVVDYDASPPLVTSGSTTYKLVQLQSNGRWSTDGLLLEIGISDQELNFYEIGGLVTIGCKRV
jgi:hypothetical protein